MSKGQVFTVTYKSLNGAKTGTLDQDFDYITVEDGMIFNVQST